MHKDVPNLENIVVQYTSAQIYKNINGKKYVLCIFEKPRNLGYHMQWVRANKVGEDYE